MRLRACDRKRLTHWHINVVIQRTKIFDFCIALKLLIKVVLRHGNHSKACAAVSVVEFLQIGILFCEGALRRGIHHKVGFPLPLFCMDKPAIHRWEAIGPKLTGPAQARQTRRNRCCYEKYRGPNYACLSLCHRGSTHHTPIWINPMQDQRKIVSADPRWFQAGKRPAGPCRDLGSLGPLGRGRLWRKSR